MKPLKHARISASRYGRTWQDWYPLHDWFDKTKAAYPKLTHRAFLHNECGIDLACEIFPDPPGAGSIRQVSEDHQIEDLGRVVRVQEWLEALDATQLEEASTRARRRRSRTERDLGHAPAEYFADHYGGLAADYRPVLDFLERPIAAAGGDPKARWLWLNSFGIYLADDLFGPVLALDDGSLVSTRQIGEDYVRSRLGFIPALADVAARIRFRDWMLGTGVREGLRQRKQLELAEETETA